MKPPPTHEMVWPFKLSVTLSATTISALLEHCRSAVSVVLLLIRLPQLRAMALWAPTAKSRMGRSARTLRIVFIFLSSPIQQGERTEQFLDDWLFFLLSRLQACLH